jgi:hypothetical protein
MPWNWGLHVNIPPPAGASSQPAKWNKLQCNPIGLYDLRRRLGVLQVPVGTFLTNQSRFLASDLVWFADGSHKDGNHQVVANHFHPSFLIVRRGTTAEEHNTHRKKVLDLLLDVVSIRPTVYFE